MLVVPGVKSTKLGEIMAFWAVLARPGPVLVRHSKKRCDFKVSLFEPSTGPHATRCSVRINGATSAIVNDACEVYVYVLACVVEERSQE